MLLANQLNLNILSLVAIKHVFSSDIKVVGIKEKFELFLKNFNATSLDDSFWESYKSFFSLVSPLNQEEMILVKIKNIYYYKIFSK